MGPHLHVAALEHLAQPLAKVREERRQRHAQGNHHKQEADCLRRQDPVLHRLPAAAPTGPQASMHIKQGMDHDMDAAGGGGGGVGVSVYRGDSQSDKGKLPAGCQEETGSGGLQA